MGKQGIDRFTIGQAFVNPLLHRQIRLYSRKGILRPGRVDPLSLTPSYLSSDLEGAVERQNGSGLGRGSPELCPGFLAHPRVLRIQTSEE